MASLCVALFAVYSKHLLPLVDHSPWKLNYYNCVNGIFLFLPFIILFGEVGVVTRYPELASSYFWSMMTFTGVMGTVLGYFAGLQIKVTSSLTHNVSGTAKACFQTVLAVVFNHEVKTYLWWLSNVMVLVGSAVYAMVRHSEMKLSKEAPPVKDKDSDPETEP